MEPTPDDRLAAYRALTKDFPTTSWTGIVIDEYEEFLQNEEMQKRLRAYIDGRTDEERQQWAGKWTVFI